MTSTLKPPFTLDTATAKVQRAEDLWNTKHPENISLAYTPDSQWRNRVEFVQGRKAIVELLERKWARELDYILRKKLFTFAGNRIAVQFEYEYHDDSDQWFHTHGIEHWEFDEEGLMQTRQASINEIPIQENERSLF